MSSFRDLQKIYGESYLGMALNPSPNKSYAPEESNHSYRRGGMRFNSGDSDNLFATNALKTGIAIADDEEHEHGTEGAIDKMVVLKKIKELSQTANQDEMMYAVHLLGQLKEFIKAN